MYKYLIYLKFYFLRKFKTKEDIDEILFADCIYFQNNINNYLLKV